MNITTGPMIRKTPKPVTTIRMFFNQERQLARSDVEGFKFKRWHCCAFRAWVRAAFRLIFRS